MIPSELTVAHGAGTVSRMLYLAISAAVIAVLAWDGWRRKLAFEADRETKWDERLTAVEQLAAKLASDAERNEQIVRHGVEEARRMVAPIRSQLLEAQQRKMRG